MTPIEKAAAYVVGIAEAEIGYCEKASNANLNDKTANAGSNNWTKYAAYFDAQRGTYNFYNGRKNGPAGEWCDMFFDWVQCQAWGIDTARKMLYQPMDSCGAGCVYSAAYYRANGAWTLTPRVGDQIFFGSKGNENHTGIVVDVSSDKVWTVEGNANNRVMRREYALNAGNIAGYGRPDYNLVAYKFAEPVTPDTPIKDDDEPFTADEKTEIQRMIDDTIVRRFGKEIKKISDIPHKSVQKVMRRLLDLESVDGGTPYATDPDDINLGAYDFVRVLVMAARYADAKFDELGDIDDGQADA